MKYQVSVSVKNRNSSLKRRLPLFKDESHLGKRVIIAYVNSIREVSRKLILFAHISDMPGGKFSQRIRHIDLLAKEPSMHTDRLIRRKVIRVCFFFVVFGFFFAVRPILVASRLRLALVLLNPNIPCFFKQCRLGSAGFCRSQLIWIYTVCH